MVELTLLRFDVDVESVTARANAYAPFARSVGGDADGETGAELDVETPESGSGRMKAGLAAALVGLVFLVVAGVLLRRYLTEGEAEAEPDEAETAPVTIE